MTTDFRSICAELVHIANALDCKNALVSNQGQAMDGYSALAAFRDVANRARAALAAEADGPAVPEGRDSVYVMKMPTQRQLMLLADEMNLPSVGDAAAYARAVLARYGNQPCAVCGRSAPPAAGEVAELALKELERTVVLLMPVTGHKKIKRFDTIRAALKRLQELENKADLSPTPMPLPAVEVK